MVQQFHNMDQKAVSIGISSSGGVAFEPFTPADTYALQLQANITDTARLSIGRMLRSKNRSQAVKKYSLLNN